MKYWIALLLFFQSAFGSFSFFIPPPKWQIVDPKTLSKYTKMAFIGERKNSFCPTINLAVETVDISQKKYVKIVKKMHQKDPNTTWRDLGDFTCTAGTGKLTELQTRSKAGTIRMFQFILVKGEKAYVITAAGPKDGFLDYRKDFSKAIQSFTITDDLISCISDETKKSYLQMELTKLDQLSEKNSDKKKSSFENIQKFVLEDCKEMGPFWQVLAARSFQQKYAQN